MDYYQKYLKYKNKYIEFKNQYGGNTLENVELHIDNEEITISNIKKYIDEGVIVPTGLPDVLKPYAESYPYKIVLGNLKWSMEALLRERARLLQLQLSLSDEITKLTELNSKIDALIGEANRYILYLEVLIASKPYNQKEVEDALNIHQQRLGPPPNWKEILPLKKAYIYEIFSPENVDKKETTFERAEPFRLQAIELCNKIEKNLAFYNAQGYFQRRLESDAFSQFDILFH
jgi:hypothetical protein